MRRVRFLTMLLALFWVFGTGAYGQTGDSVPQGKGGVKIPSFTSPQVEPIIVIKSGGKIVAKGMTGKIYYLDPGEYELEVITSAPENLRPKQKFTVTAGSITEIKPNWGAVVIDVVDEKNISFNGSYDLIYMKTKEYIGTGNGANRLSGEPLNTWFLVPGLYKIVKNGGTYRDRTNFITIYVLPGELSHIKLVMDRLTGDFKGGGVTFDDEPTIDIKGLKVSGTIGGEFAFTQKDNMVGENNGRYYTINAFIDTDLLYDSGSHYFYSFLQGELGFSKTPEYELQKTTDYFRIDGFYLYKITPKIGPYFQYAFITNLMNGYDYFSENQDVKLLDKDKNTVEELTGVSKVKISPFFGTLEFREGIGLNFRPFKSYYIDAFIRGGVGAQQSLLNDVYAKEDDPATKPIEYVKKDTYHSEGLNFSLLVMGSFTGWLTYNGSVWVLAPFDNMSEPVVDTNLVISLHLIKYFSLNYSFKIIKDVNKSKDWQYQNLLLFRFSIPFI